MQHLIRTQFGIKFHQRYMFYNPCQVNRGFDTRVTPTNHGYTFAFEQWTITVRTVGYTTGFVFLLTWNIHLSPACAGRQNYSF
ncbi:Uncharacterised protein [Mycobacteroides abscessus]|nr:Uncharacterised protein [Mycobacteroides abscessus]